MVKLLFGDSSNAAKYAMHINEIHYQDLYPDSFQQFRKKYLPLLRKRQVYDLWIQFSNFADNTMDRNASPTQDHHDPSGVYAYPIAYVLNYPGDVWYGLGAKYMRVLKATTKKALPLGYIQDANKCQRMLNNAGFTVPEINEMMWLANKHYKNRTSGTNKWGKIFLTCMQIDLVNPPIGQNQGGMFSKGGPEYRIRSGPEQTALFLKMGVDAIIDSASTNKSAIINDREPEQICFLTRAAFRVEEVYDLRGGMQKEKLPTFTSPDPSGTYIERALVSAILKGMDDQISESSRDETTRKKLDMAYRYYWTKKGRRVEVTFERPNSYYTNRKMGEKKHKESKLYSLYRTDIKIETELGSMRGRFAEDTKFSDIISDMYRNWKNLQENPKPDGWEPETSDSFMDKVKAEKDEYYRQQREKEHKERMEEMPKFLEDVKFVANHYNLPFSPNDDNEMNAKLSGMLQWFSNHWRQVGGDEKEPVESQVKHWYESCEQWLGMKNQLEMMPQIHQLGEILMLIAHKYEWDMRMGKHMFSHIASNIREKAEIWPPPVNSYFANKE